jgi:hypothetical protein
VARVPAGRHVFWSKAENTSALELVVEAGATYYLKLKMKPGFNMPRAKLSVVDRADAEEHLESCARVTATGEGQARAAEIVAHRLDRAERKAARRGARRD